jgi:hypothetical protein
LPWFAEQELVQRAIPAVPFHDPAGLVGYRASIPMITKRDQH